jgi:hypothetical protein
VSVTTLAKMSAGWIGSLQAVENTCRRRRVGHRRLPHHPHHLGAIRLPQVADPAALMSPSCRCCEDFLHCHSMALARDSRQRSPSPRRDRELRRGVPESESAEIRRVSAHQGQELSGEWAGTVRACGVGLPHPLSPAALPRTRHRRRTAVHASACRWLLAVTRVSGTGLADQCG